MTWRPIRFQSAGREALLDRHNAWSKAELDVRAGDVVKNSCYRRCRALGRLKAFVDFVPGICARFCGLGNVCRARPFFDQVVRFQRDPGACPDSDGALFRGGGQHPARHLDR